MPFITPPLPKKPILTKRQIARLSNILDNAGQVFLATLGLTPIVTVIFQNITLDVNHIIMVVSGIIITIGCWFISLYLEGRIKQ